MFVSGLSQTDSNNVGSLAGYLELLTVDDLKSLLKLLPVEKKPSRKSELAKAIKESLLGGNLYKLWDRLDNTQKFAVSETLYSYGGTFNPVRFQAKYGLLPDFTDEESNARYSYSAKPGLLRVLMYHGDRYNRSDLVIPSDLLHKLQAFVPTPLTDTLKTVNCLPDAFDGHSINSRDTEVSALQDLLTIMSLTSQNKISVSNKTLLPSKTTMNTLSTILRNGDYYTADDTDSFGESIEPIKAFAWPLLIQAAKLAEAKGGKLALTKTGVKALSAPPAETIKLIWHRWLKTKLIDEFSRIDNIKGQKRKTRSAISAASDRRPVISRMLSKCPVGEWIALEEFSRFMQSENHLFEITTDPWELYIGDPHYGSLGYGGSHDWNILQKRYIACLLFEYAATLGLIDVAYVHPEHADCDYAELWGADDLLYLSRYDGLVYFRITALGEYCLDLTDGYVPKEQPSKARLSVLPNLHIQSVGVMEFGQSQLLELYTDKISGTQWRFNPEKMLAAAERGHDIQELEKFLSQSDEQPLPESVEALIRKVQRQACALKIKSTTILIECIDAETARKVANHDHTKHLCMLAGEKHLVLTSTEKAFRGALRKLGYGMPLV
ncbi:helicase-associated domain-containing protein [Bowmanella denitrificans]|uniref:helicase-associated domain-containing protein n=1 Tax=Bowmanella denitrificans TaxID=366582 RepID=UPI000C9B81A8|nr:helicase-associated domain-containing protein [Bowmanella denitrificans]